MIKKKVFELTKEERKTIVFFIEMLKKSDNTFYKVIETKHYIASVIIK